MAHQRLFIFKQFSVKHSDSAMKIGVDGVLTGAWAELPETGRVLDAGSGCGLIALMCAQRNPLIKIDAVECDPAAAAEAIFNYKASPWQSRIRQMICEWSEAEGKYDLIISNPPFFESGISTPDSARLKSRHAAALSPRALLRLAPAMLASDGSLAMVSPVDSLSGLLEEASKSGMYLSRLCKVKGHPHAPVKRILSQWRLTEPQKVEYELLTLHYDDGLPTAGYRRLCSEFYTKEKY